MSRIIVNINVIQIIICLLVTNFNENEVIETTVGQLNFFKWVIENRVIEAYKKDKPTIDQVMLSDGFKIKLEGRGRMKKKMNAIPHVSSTSSVQSLPHVSSTSSVQSLPHVSSTLNK
jgi:hypothetical protein